MYYLVVFDGCKIKPFKNFDCVQLERLRVLAFFDQLAQALNCVLFHVYKYLQKNIIYGQTES